MEYKRSNIDIGWDKFPPDIIMESMSDVMYYNGLAILRAVREAHETITEEINSRVATGEINSNTAFSMEGYINSGFSQIELWPGITLGEFFDKDSEIGTKLRNYKRKSNGT